MRFKCPEAEKEQSMCKHNAFVSISWYEICYWPWSIPANWRPGRNSLERNTLMVLFMFFSANFSKGWYTFNTHLIGSMKPFEPRRQSSTSQFHKWTCIWIASEQKEIAAVMFRPFHQKKVRDWLKWMWKNMCSWFIISAHTI